MKRQGKGARRNAKQNAENKKRFIKDSIYRCQMCGASGSLSNSHSRNSDRRLDSVPTALLCIFVCHRFIELECSHEERERVNKFLIESDLDPGYRMEAALELLPKEKADKWRKLIYDARVH